MKRFKQWRIKRIDNEILSATRRINNIKARLDRLDLTDEAYEHDVTVLDHERERLWWKRNSLYAKHNRLKENL